MSRARSGHGEQVRVSGARASEAGPAASGSAAFRNHPPCPETSPCQLPAGVTATASRGGPARPCRKLRGDVSVQPGRGTPALPQVPSSSGAPGPLPSAGADPSVARLSGRGRLSLAFRPLAPQPLPVARLTPPVPAGPASRSLEASGDEPLIPLGNLSFSPDSYTHVGERLLNFLLALF